MASIHHPNPPELLGAFGPDTPLQALLRDHHLVRELARYYLSSDSPAVKKQAATQLLHAIHAHSRLEESVFYPGVRGIEPNLIAQLEEEHLTADDLLATLGVLDMAEPRFDNLLRELIDVVLAHMDEEETELFPMLQHAAFDMTPVGLEMQAFEANLVHLQGQLSNGGVRH